MFRMCSVVRSRGRVYVVEVAVYVCVWMVICWKARLYDCYNLIWQNGRLVFESLAGNVKGSFKLRDQPEKYTI